MFAPDAQDPISHTLRWRPFILGFTLLALSPPRASAQSEVGLILNAVLQGLQAAEAIRLARPSLEEKYRVYKEWGQDKVMPAGDHFGLDFEALMQDRFLFGSPAEVTEQILTLKRRFGVTTVMLGIHWVGMPLSLVTDQMRLIKIGRAHV